MSYTSASAETGTPGGLGILTPEQFQDFLETNFRKANAREMATPVQGMKYWNVQKTSLDHENHTYVTGFRLVPKSRDADEIPLGEAVQGFSNTYTPEDYRMGYGFERRLRETGQYRLITKIQRGMQKAGSMTVEYLMVDPWNRGFGTVSAPWLCADGMFLFDSARPLEDGSGEWSNLETPAALTMNSLETAKVAGRKMVNERGFRAPVRYTRLIVPPDLERKGREVTESVLDPETALNTKNVVGDRGLKLEVWDLLTDTSAWFLAGDAGDSDYELYWYWRVRPGIETYVAGSNPDVHYQRVRFSCISGADRPHLARGNAGA